MKKKKWTNQVLVRLQDSQKPHSMLVWMQNGAATLEDSVAVFLYKKLNKRPSDDPAIQLLVFTHVKWKHVFIQKPVCECL